MNEYEDGSAEQLEQELAEYTRRNQPSAASFCYGEDLERRTREGRLTFVEAVAKLTGRHCRFVERHGVRLQLSDGMKLVDENYFFPSLDANAYLADNWHIVKP